VFKHRPLLLKVIMTAENFRGLANHFDCAGASPFDEG